MNNNLENFSKPASPDHQKKQIEEGVSDFLGNGNIDKESLTEYLQDIQDIEDKYAPDTKLLEKEEWPKIEDVMFNEGYNRGQESLKKVYEYIGKIDSEEERVRVLEEFYNKGDNVWHCYDIQEFARDKKSHYDIIIERVKSLKLPDKVLFKIKNAFEKKMGQAQSDFEDEEKDGKYGMREFHENVNNFRDSVDAYCKKEKKDINTLEVDEIKKINPELLDKIFEYKTSPYANDSYNYNKLISGCISDLSDFDLKMKDVLGVSERNFKNTILYKLEMLFGKNLLTREDVERANKIFEQQVSRLEKEYQNENPDFKNYSEEEKEKAFSCDYGRAYDITFGVEKRRIYKELTDIYSVEELEKKFNIPNELFQKIKDSK